MQQAAGGISHKAAMALCEVYKIGKGPFRSGDASYYRELLKEHYQSKIKEVEVEQAARAAMNSDLEIMEKFLVENSGDMEAALAAYYRYIEK